MKDDENKIDQNTPLLRRNEQQDFDIVLKDDNTLTNLYLEALKHKIKDLTLKKDQFKGIESDLKKPAKRLIKSAQAFHDKIVSITQQCKISELACEEKITFKQCLTEYEELQLFLQIKSQTNAQLKKRISDLEGEKLLIQKLTSNDTDSRAKLKELFAVIDKFSAKTKETRKEIKKAQDRKRIQSLMDALNIFKDEYKNAKAAFDKFLSSAKPTQFTLTTPSEPQSVKEQMSDEESSVNSCGSVGSSGGSSILGSSVKIAIDAAAAINPNNADNNNSELQSPTGSLTPTTRSNSPHTPPLIDFNAELLKTQQLEAKLKLLAEEEENKRVELERQQSEAENRRVEIEKQRREEQIRRAEESERQRREEEKRIADESERQKRAEEKRRAEETERQRREEEKRRAEESERQRREEEKRRAEETERQKQSTESNNVGKKNNAPSATNFIHESPRQTLSINNDSPRRPTTTSNNQSSGGFFSSLCCFFASARPKSEPLPNYEAIRNQIRYLSEENAEIILELLKDRLLTGAITEAGKAPYELSLFANDYAVYEDTANVAHEINIPKTVASAIEKIDIALGLISKKIFINKAEQLLETLDLFVTASQSRGFTRYDSTQHFYERVIPEFIQEKIINNPSQQNRVK